MQEPTQIPTKVRPFYLRHPAVTAIGALAIAAGVRGIQNRLRKQAEARQKFVHSMNGRFEEHERYYLYVPSQAANEVQGTSDLQAAVASRSRPLLVVLHGCLQNAFKMAQGTRLNHFAERDGFLVLYPAQRWPRHIQNCWKWYKYENQKRDSGELAEIMAMVREVQARYAIDPKQVYVTGLSSGAGVAASLLACYPDVFAGGVLHSGPAFASAQGLLEGVRVQMWGPGSKAKPSPPVANPRVFKGDLLVVQGTKDKTIHPSHAERLIEQFLPEGEKAIAQTVSVTNTKQGGLNGRLTLYGPQAVGTGRTRVAKFEIEGLGHAWSGGDDSVQFNNSKGPDLSAAVVSFLIEKKSPFTLVAAGEVVSAPMQAYRGMALSPA